MIKLLHNVKKLPKNRTRVMWVGQVPASRLTGSDKKTDSGEKVATQSGIHDQRYRTQPDIKHPISD
jgi:hypothetical protein